MSEDTWVVDAVRLADMLSEIGARVPALNALALEGTQDHDREAYARAAKCSGPPSGRTWGLVITILRDRERRALRAQMARSGA